MLRGGGARCGLDGYTKERTDGSIGSVEWMVVACGWEEGGEGWMWMCAAPRKGEWKDGCGCCLVLLWCAWLYEWIVDGGGVLVSNRSINQRAPIVSTNLVCTQHTAHISKGKTTHTHAYLLCTHTHMLCMNENRYTHT